MSRSHPWLMGLTTLSMATSLTHLPSAQAQVNFQQACIQSTAEAFVVPASSIRVTQVGPVEATTGARTLTLQNTTSGQTALCNFSTIDNKVTSVQIMGTTPPPTLNYRQTCIQRTAEAFVVPASSIVITEESPTTADFTKTLFLRNQQNGQRAECRVNIRTNQVVSVRINTPAPPLAINYRQACLQRTAEAFVIPASSVAITGQSPIAANGTRTLFMRNQQNGQRADCRVNTRTGQVISVNLNTPQPR